MSEIIITDLRISIASLVVDCQECATSHNGFVSDPSGTSFNCDGCGNKIIIPSDVTIMLT